MDEAMPEPVEVLINGIWKPAFVLSWSLNGVTMWAHVRTLDDAFGCFPETEVRDPA